MPPRSAPGPRTAPGSRGGSRGGSSRGTSPGRGGGRGRGGGPPQGPPPPRGPVAPVSILPNVTPAGERSLSRTLCRGRTNNNMRWNSLILSIVLMMVSMINALCH